MKKYAIIYLNDEDWNSNLRNIYKILDKNNFKNIQGSLLEDIAYRGCCLTVNYICLNLFDREYEWCDDTGEIVEEDLDEYVGGVEYYGSIKEVLPIIQGRYKI